MIYLASPFFNEEELNVYHTVIEYLRNMGEEVFVPQEHKIENAWDLSNEEWGSQVFGMDLQALMKCDEVIVLYWGLYSDSGTSWEAGAAFAMGKKITVVLCYNETRETSLMVANGCHNVVHLDDFLENRFHKDSITKDLMIQK